MKQLFTGWLFFVVMSYSIKAQDKDAAATQQLIESQNYIFKAQTVSPARGAIRNLTPEYDLVIKKDSVIAWLPFFGRSYAPQYNSEGGIKFNSVNFAYSARKAKKKRWEITIKPIDAPEVQYLYLTVYENSEAYLQVISTNRESISFNGYIIEGRPTAKKGF